MSAQSEKSIPESDPADLRPIELVTENGFAVLRRWEIDGMPPPATGNYRFIVRNPQSLEREITVVIDVKVVVRIEMRTWGRILPGSTFWICCAERHLANYLWVNDACPPGNTLSVEQLDPEECMSAIRWNQTVNRKGSKT